MVSFKMSFIKDTLSHALAMVFGTILAVIIIIGLIWLTSMYLHAHPEIIKNALKKIILG